MEIKEESKAMKKELQCRLDRVVNHPDFLGLTDYEVHNEDSMYTCVVQEDKVLLFMNTNEHQLIFTLVDLEKNQVAFTDLIRNKFIDEEGKIDILDIHQIRLLHALNSIDGKRRIVFSLQNNVILSGNVINPKYYVEFEQRTPGKLIHVTDAGFLAKPFRTMISGVVLKFFDVEEEIKFYKNFKTLVTSSENQAIHLPPTLSTTHNKFGLDQTVVLKLSKDIFIFRSIHGQSYDDKIKSDKLGAKIQRGEPIVDFVRGKSYVCFKCFGNRRFEVIVAATEGYVIKISFRCRRNRRVLRRRTFSKFSTNIDRNIYSNLIFRRWEYYYESDTLVFDYGWYAPSPSNNSWGLVIPDG